MTIIAEQHSKLYDMKREYLIEYDMATEEEINLTETILSKIDKFSSMILLSTPKNIL